MTHLASNGTNYGNLDYWEGRYARDPEPFEWYQRFVGIRHFLTREYLVKSNTLDNDTIEVEASTFPPKENCRVLIIGCGNSRLGEEMIYDNWNSGLIKNIDYSSTVVRQMQERYNDEFYQKVQNLSDREKNTLLHSFIDDKGFETGKTNKIKLPKKKSAHTKMSFEFADVTERLPFPESEFDMIICKATLDSILCSNGALSSVESMMKECARVLDVNHGVMVVVTHGNPDNRMSYFKNAEDEWWRGGIKVHTVPKPVIGISGEDKGKPK